MIKTWVVDDVDISTTIHNQSVTRKPCRLRLTFSFSTPYFPGVDFILRKYSCARRGRMTKYKSSPIERIVNVIIFVMQRKVNIVGDYSRNPIFTLHPII